MTVLTGEKAIFETLRQFLNRTPFEMVDVLEALDKSEDVEISGVDESLLDEFADYHEQYPEEFPEAISEYEDIPEDEAWGLIDAVGETQAINAVLEADIGNWVYLTDGMQHTVVEITGPASEELVL